MIVIEGEVVYNLDQLVMRKHLLLMTWLFDLVSSKGNEVEARRTPRYRGNM